MACIAPAQVIQCLIYIVHRKLFDYRGDFVACAEFQHGCDCGGGGDR